MPKSDGTFHNQPFHKRAELEGWHNATLTKEYPLSAFQGLQQSIPEAEFCRSTSLTEAFHFFSWLLTRKKEKIKTTGEGKSQAILLATQ